MAAHSPCRIVFAGTPGFAVPSLKALVADPHYTVVAVYSQPDRRAGRGRQLMATPVKQCAMEAGIPVETPVNFADSMTRAILAAYKPDIMVVAAYGLLLPQSVLDIPTYGCINIHASLLPRWRGAAPIQAAILAGDQETGVGIMRMEKGLDTGGVYLESRLPITQTCDAQTLTDKLALLGSEALLDVLYQQTYVNQPIPQPNEGITYAHKIKKSDAAIDWHQSAEAIQKHIRAYWPWPGAFTFYEDKRLKISASSVIAQPSTQRPGTIESFNDQGMLVATQDNLLCIEACQPEGKQLKPAHQWLTLFKQGILFTSST